MAWQVKAIFDILGTLLIIVGEQYATQNALVGHSLAAVGAGVLAAGEYLFEKGIITRLRAR